MTKIDDLFELEKAAQKLVQAAEEVTRMDELQLLAARKQFGFRFLRESSSAVAEIISRLRSGVSPVCEDGALEIALEHQRQIAEEGYSPEHDEQYTRGELLDAAVAYIRAIDPADPGANANTTVCEAYWPWAPTTTFKPKDVRRNLVRAGALIAAEIDRLDALRHAGEKDR